MEWIDAHAPALNVLVGLITAAVWIGYFQLLYSQLRRNRRSMILITRSGDTTLDARCFVCNMGAEPIHLSRILARVTTKDDSTYTSLVTDREEYARGSFATPAQETTQGPIAPGGFRDVGSYGDLLWRVGAHKQKDFKGAAPLRLELTVMADSSHEAAVVAGRRLFRIGRQGEAMRVVPENASTQQIRGRAARHELGDVLQKALDAEIADLRGTEEIDEAPVREAQPRE